MTTSAGLVLTSNVADVKLNAKAVLASLLDPGHMNIVGNILSGMGYNDIGRYASSVQIRNGIANSRILYTYGHGKTGTANGQELFFGPDFSGSVILFGYTDFLAYTDLPEGLSITLCFFNGCNSAINGALSFQVACGTNCAYLGWTTTVRPINVRTPAVDFFQTLANGSSITGALGGNLVDTADESTCVIVPDNSKGSQTLDMR